MTVKKEELDKAHSILRAFERKDIDHSEFSWKYITDRVKASRQSLWRNDDFIEEFNRVKLLMKSYAKRTRAFDHELIKKSHEEMMISKLKQEIENLKSQLNRERERLAYAQLVARQRGIDPLEFMDESPLSKGLVEH